MIPAAFLLVGAMVQPSVAERFSEVSHTKDVLLSLDPGKINQALNTARQWATKYAWAAAEAVNVPDDVYCGTFCGCKGDKMISVSRYFRGQSRGDKPKVDFIPTRDSDSFTSKLSRKTTTTVTNTFSWENSHTVKLDAELNIGFGLDARHGFKIGLGYEYQNTNTEINSTSVALEQSVEHQCKEGYFCQFWTLSFEADYDGEYFDMPVIDFGQCLDSRQTGIRWQSAKDANTFHTIGPDSKNSLASLIGKSRAWDSMATRYFTLKSNKTGEVLSEAPPGGPIGIGVEFPPNDIVIEPKDKVEQKGAIFPVYAADSPYKALITVEWRPKTTFDQRRGLVPRLNKDYSDLSKVNPGEIEGSITIEPM